MLRRRQDHHAARAGFSLVELLIVMGILVIIAALAIPNFFRAKQRANEASAVASLRTVASMQITYSTTYNIGFAPSLAALGPPPGGAIGSDNAALIDSVLASGIKSGYSFVYTPLDADGNGQFDQYIIRANPVSPGQTGDQYFFMDQTGVIRGQLESPADKSSDPIPM